MPPAAAAAAAADSDNNSDDDGIAVGDIGPAEVHNMAEENAVMAEDEDEEEMCSMDGSVDLLEQALVVVGMLPSHPFESGLPKLSDVRMFAFCFFWYC